MASNRSNTNGHGHSHGRQGPQCPQLKHQLPSNTTPAPRTPLTSTRPRLGQHSTAHFRPKLRDTPDTRPRTARNTPDLDPDPDLDLDLHLDADLLRLNVTPRSSSRKSRVDSSHSTPQEQERDHPHPHKDTDIDIDTDTPSHARKRPLMTSPTNTEPQPRRTQLAVRPNLTKAKSLVSSSRPSTNAPRSVPPATKPTVRGYSARSQPPTPASAPHLTLRPAPHVSAHTPVHRPVSARSATDTPRSTTASSPMFFRANEARTHPALHPHDKQPPQKKSPAFLYADGQQERDGHERASSPPLSQVSDMRSPHLVVQPPRSDPTDTPALASPPLSATSTRSFNFQSSVTNSPSFGPSSPPKSNNIHLSYRKGASQIIGIGGSLLPERLPFQPTQRKTSLTSVRSAHVKRSSLSSIDSGSPNEPRRQSHPVSHNLPPPVAEHTHASPATTDPPSPALLVVDTNHDPEPPQETVQSPVQSSGVDVHAEARRERKVLDLEISNSSLLAINKSLEREVRRQKAELKRFRRLSRAGQFAVPERRSSVEDLSTLDEEDDLPAFNSTDVDGGRPSSPFLEQPSEDYSDGESTASSSAQAERDAAHRADDESHLRLDLSRHRELLLDTQRMNQSLQRCLYWTEGLIKDGRKALDYHVTSTDVKLGGHILSGDDFDDTSSQAGYADSANGQSEVPTGAMENENRNSVGSEMDSGIDLGKRGPLVMSKNNPHHTLSLSS